MRFALQARHIHRQGARCSRRPLHRPAMAAPVDDRVDATRPETAVGYVQRWEDIWKAGLPAGARWDRNSSSPALKDLLGSGALPVAGKRVLVPGCGRGYDLCEFAAAGATEAVGLEISATAVQEAEAFLASNPQGAASAARMVLDNFFEWQDPQGPFDVGFDYTFGCAMHPADREKWAQGWARAIRPGGTLITLLYPVDPSADANVGPPFPISPELYKGLLSDLFTLVSMQPVPDALSHEGRAGKEHLGIWTRK